MKKGLIVSIIAILAASAGIILAVAKFMKKSSKKISEDLDYNEDDFLQDDFDSADAAAMIGPEVDESVDFDTDEIAVCNEEIVDEIPEDDEEEIIE